MVQVTGSTGRQAASKDKSEPWQVTVDTRANAGSAVSVRRQKFSPAAIQTLELTSLDAENISTLPIAKPRCRRTCASTRRARWLSKASLSRCCHRSELNLVIPIKIGKITLQGGDVRFSDNFIKPNYSANLKQDRRHDQRAVVGGQRRTLELRGSYDNIAPLKITGRLNPLSACPLSGPAGRRQRHRDDLAVAVLRKYAGYAIEKGQAVAVRQVQDREQPADAENRVFLDQLTFGEAVDSPEATKLPVTLAVALLKNRKGEIDINLPISGSLTIRSSVSAAWWQGDRQSAGEGGHLAVCAARFDISAAARSCRTSSSIIPEYAAISARSAQQRLQTPWPRCSIDRPALKLEIEGRVDPDRDPKGSSAHYRAQGRASCSALRNCRRAVPKLESLAPDTVERRQPRSIRSCSSVSTAPRTSRSRATWSGW
jgi:hypothetical protein